MVDGRLNVTELASGEERVTAVQNGRVLVPDDGGCGRGVLSPTGASPIESEVTPEDLRAEQES